MKRSWLSIVGLAALGVASAVLVLPATAEAPPAAKAKPKTHQFSGQIVRTGSGQFVVKTRTNEELIFFTNQQTKCLKNNKVVQFSDLSAPSNVTIVAVQEGDRYVVETVTVVTEEPVPPAEGTLLEGEIIRVVGEDQVVIRTAERKEVIVYVDKQTTYQLENKAARFTDLRSGQNVHINVNVHNGKHMAQKFVVPPKRK